MSNIAFIPREHACQMLHIICDYSQQILNSIDENVDPCDDFYKFACGKFIREALIPDDRERIDSLSMIKDRVYDQLKEHLLEGGHAQEPTLPRLVKDFYGICLNGAGEGINGLKPLLDIMKKLGGWPVLEGDNWNEENSHGIVRYSSGRLTVTL